MDRQQFTSLLAFLKAVPDPRQARGKRYAWVHLLAIVCAALLSGQLTGSAIVDWAALHGEEILQCLGSALQRIPSAATLRRVLRYMNIEVLERLVAELIQSLDRQREASGSIRSADGQLLRGQALDGKELRGASAHGDRACLVSLVRHDTGATLIQEAVGPESSEYGAKGHGRIETRTLTCSPGLRRYLHFPGVKQVARRRCQRVEVKSGKRADEVTYAITSLDRQQAGACHIELLWRRHWTIENKSHYIRDETLREDRCQMHKGDAAQAMAALRNLLLATLRFHGWTNMAQAFRHYGASVQKAFVFLGADGL